MSGLGSKMMMADNRQKRLSDLVEPFRVRPGAEARLGRDVDLSFKHGVRKRQDGVALLADGFGLPSNKRGSPPRTRGECWWFGRHLIARARTERSPHMMGGVLWRYAQRLPARGQPNAGS
jgi:hypothetical protein